ncbi:ArsR/SmtB family transcription factor [Aeromicrobium fastidiosum]|uniref:Helix-turn-helix transcriptional regulator n=1 Tax=Aeromicrobium fastidiosum TaxID=52699 RepID=A0A641ANL5_9ACTN|nr:metalloregulator ArsR/SmtB family transcription factor [Aeromicrobium fastidiosum]KAA1379676.1 helix-turn-helix transcriptional regulator [Aeromicrobium fastidiosum]MBP2389153.1 ArsR family transcriptional regulator [Aeromicrobium fastidiosum]
MTTVLPVLDLGSDLCCAPIVRDAMSAQDAANLALKFKAIGEPTRLRLLSLVAAHDGAEACVCDLTEPVNLSQGTVSHHLKVLVDAGLLTRSKRGTWSFYALVPGALDNLADILRTPAAQ